MVLSLAHSAGLMTPANAQAGLNFCRRIQSTPQQLAAKAMMLAGILSMAFFPMYYA